jgi:inorganic pyrophosphatase
MNFDKLAAGPNPRPEINVIVKAPLRSDPIKYRFDRTAGAIVVDRCRHRTRFCPCT